MAPRIIELITGAYAQAYELNTQEAGLGHTRFAYGVGVFESALYFLELSLTPLGGVPIRRRGNSFLVILGSCTLRFYSDSHNNVGTFKLNGRKSRTRQRLLTNNSQLALFESDPGSGPDPTIVPDLIIIHSGDPNRGLTSLHIGILMETPMGETWLWRDSLPIPNRFGSSPTIDPEPSEPPPPYSELPPPEVDVEPLREDEDDEGSASGIE